jgi:hypothetical protein
MFGFRKACAPRASLAISFAALSFSAALCMGQTLATTPSAIPAVPVAPVSPASQGISYQNGRLTIHTEGSTLAEVLQSVAGKIGAVIDVPTGSGGERIIEHATGSADEVLTSLLSGSEFNFVIVTSPGSPHVPTRVLLTSRSGGSAMPTSEVASADPAGASEPQLYGGGFSVSPEDEQAAQAAPPPPTTGTGEQLSPEAIEAMVKERLRLRHLQQDQAAQQQAPPQ